MSKIKAVLFDFDGTIFDTNRLIIESWQHLFIAKRGVPEDEGTIKASFGEPLLETMEKLFPGEVDECVDIYRSYQRDIFNDMIEVYPGMAELIKKLKTLGYKNAIVTSRLSSSTKETLEQFDLLRYFDEIVSCDDTDIHKPNPEPALLALKKLGVEADEAIMVGDSYFDVLCAQNAGVKAVLVGWSEAASHTADKLGNGFEPDYIIEKAEDLIEIIR